MIKRVLIVEDEVVVALDIQRILAKLGYSVAAVVNTGEKAISMAMSENPDIILMDICLKSKMDGIEAARQIRSNSDIPIVFLTAFAEEDKLERAKQIMFYGYLLKPIQEREIKVTLEMALYVAKADKERKHAQEALKKANDELEQKITDRTAALQREIEERKQVEASLEMAKDEAESANQVKTEFLANISHELRNPMHQIASYAKFGVEKYHRITDEKRIHYFNQIKNSSSRLMVLLNNLLDLSKHESGRMEYQVKENDLSKIIDDAICEVKLSLEEKQLAVELENNNAAESVYCDSYKIGQVVRNLLSNTIKFSSDNQKIQINIVASTFEKDGRTMPAAMVSVIDQGVGIPEDEINTIFDKFNQSSRTKSNVGGTGLGLSICQQIIKAHQGKIWAENNPGGGATFKFMLPCLQPEII